MFRIFSSKLPGKKEIVTTTPTVLGPWEYKSDFDVAQESAPAFYQSITDLDVKQEIEEFPQISSKIKEKYKTGYASELPPWHPLTSNLYGRVFRIDRHALIQLADVKNHCEFYLEPVSPIEYGHISLGCLDKNYIVMGVPTGLYRWQYNDKKLTALPFIKINTKHNSIRYSYDENKLMQIAKLSSDHLTLFTYSQRHNNLFLLDTKNMKQDRCNISSKKNTFLVYPKDKDAKDNSPHHLLVYDSYEPVLTLFEINFTWKRHWYAKNSKFEFNKKDSSQYLACLSLPYAILSNKVDIESQTYFELKKENESIRAYRLDQPSSHPLPFKDVPSYISEPKCYLFGDWLFLPHTFICTNLRQPSFHYQLFVNDKNERVDREQLHSLSEDEIAVTGEARYVNFHQILTTFDSPSYQFRKVDVFFKEIVPFLSVDPARIVAQYAFCLFAQKTQQERDKIEQTNKRMTGLCLIS